MSDLNEIDRKNFSFSQREGKVALPDAINLENVPHRFRALVWRHVYARMAHDGLGDAYDRYKNGSKIMTYISAYQQHIQEIYHDDVKIKGLA